MAIPVEEFIAKTRQDIERAGLNVVKHPFVEKAACGELTLEQIRSWARQFYFLVKEGPKSIANRYANCPDPTLRRELAENLYEEETGALSGSAKHADLFLEFLAALGVSREEADRTEPCAEIRAMLDSFKPQRIGPQDLLDSTGLAGLGGERATADIAQVLTKALEGHYGFKPEQLRWFYTHAVADVAHGEVHLNVLRSIATTDEAQARLREKAQAAAAGYYHAWDTYLTN